MVFSSTVFLLLFLPIFLLLYYISFLPFQISKRTSLIILSNTVLLLGSLFFYFWGETWLLFVMLGSAFLDYACGLLINYSRNNTKFSQQASKYIAKSSLVFSIIGNLSILAIFKYFNFAIDTANDILLAFGGSEESVITFTRITLPLGISFYTFQSMSYTFDVYKGIVKANRNLLNYSCFVTMFPQLVAGPIVRYRDIADQLVKRAVSLDNISYGAKRFIIGMGKKILIANAAGLTADKIFALPTNELTIKITWLGVLAYTIQIYFDFSGYSDMAIGLGRMLGFKYLENFNYPYISKSIQEFWRRWHISLSSWFRDYLYVSLGGNKISNLCTFRNLILVFLLCGLWHGANWTFIVWGLYHGAFLILERFKLAKKIQSAWRPLSHIYVLLVVMVGWVIFRSETMSYASKYLGVMFGFLTNEGAKGSIGPLLSKSLFIALYSSPIFATPLIINMQAKLEKYLSKKQGAFYTTSKYFYEIVEILIYAGVLIICTASLAMKTHNPFIYFRF